MVMNDAWQLCCMLVTPFSCLVFGGSVADGGCILFLLMLHVEQGCLLGFFASINCVSIPGLVMELVLLADLVRN